MKGKRKMRGTRNKTKDKMKGKRKMNQQEQGDKMKCKRKMNQQGVRLKAERLRARK